MTTGLVYSKKYREHKTGANHPEKPERIKHAIKVLKKSDFIKERMEIVNPYTINIEDIELAHEPSYVKKIEEMSKSGGGMVSPDTPIAANTFEIAKLSAGGTVKISNKVFERKYENGFALVRPPGHHATKNSGGGFCYFNNIAIAAKKLLKEKDVNRILIFDFDVHHGNGTQDIFYTSDEVLYLSFHQNGRTLYPGTGFTEEIGSGEGKGYNVNLPFPPGSTDENYAAAVRDFLIPLSKQFKPGMILVSVGFDAHSQDPLAQIKLTTQAYGWLTKSVMKQADKLCNSKIVFVLEGGYSIKATGDSILEMMKVLTGKKSPKLPDGSPTPFFDDAKRDLKDYWDL